MLTSIDYCIACSSSFEEKHFPTIGDIIYSFTFLAIGSIIQNVAIIPAITDMGAIIGPAKAVDHIPWCFPVTPGKTAFAAAARTTPIAKLAAHKQAPITKLSL